MHFFLVKVERPRHVVKDPDIVDDQPVGLFLAQGAVRPADRLQKVVVLHRLVQVHDLQDRRIKAGQELGGHDDELQRVRRIPKAVQELLFGVLVPRVLLPLGRVAGGGGHHDGAGLGIEDLVHGLLVEHAALPVKDHHLRLEAVRLHLLPVVVHHVPHHGSDALRVLDQHRHLGRALGQIVAVLLAERAGDLGERLVDGLPIDLEPHLGHLEMERQRGPIADGILERVAAEVALLVLIGAKGPVGVAVGPVDRRAGEAKEKGVGQRLAHLAPQVPLLGAVRLVDHDDDVGALVQAPVRLGELVDGRDEHLAHVLGEEGLKLLAGGDGHQVRHVGGVERGGDLGVQIDAVHDDEHGGVAEGRVLAEF